MTESFDEVLRNRRSVRRYQTRDVPSELVLELLELARQGPSSLGDEPWEFVVLRDPASKRELARVKNAHASGRKRDYPADFLAAAPVVVAVCVDRARSHGRARENGIIAATHLLLAARSRGLGSTYLTAYGEQGGPLTQALRDLLALPDSIEPIALVPLGYPDESPAPRQLRSIDGIVHDERFGQGVSGED